MAPGTHTEDTSQTTDIATTTYLRPLIQPTKQLLAETQSSSLSLSPSSEVMSPNPQTFTSSTNIV